LVPLNNVVHLVKSVDIRTLILMMRKLIVLYLRTMVALGYTMRARIAASSF
jgi:hypothetical protein